MLSVRHKTEVYGMSEETIRTNFNESLENLKNVHTREALKSTKKEINIWRTRLIAISPTFRKELEERKQLTKARRIVNKASSLPGRPLDHTTRREKIMREHNIEPWMMDPNLRKMNDLANSRIRAQIVGTGGLTCPECGDRDNGNKMGKTPWCMKCNVALSPKGKKVRGPKIKRHRQLTEAQKRMRGVV